MQNTLFYKPFFLFQVNASFGFLFPNTMRGLNDNCASGNLFLAKRCRLFHEKMLNVAVQHGCCVELDPLPV